MSSEAIRIEQLSKLYKIGRGSQTTLRETLAAQWRHWTGQEEFNESDFCALDDLSLSISQGDRLAIVGANGAGKSTLLKILSRITAPTAGRVTIQGRVASLLEVGTGFHPELTGRENVFLNGALLGMSQREIKAKLDDIVAFAGVEKFLDTPVKRYSSGMYTRLGFSVAAHLDSEILIVDEVLAVGDVVFQEKCIKFMDQLGRTGRTILFVSHDMQSVLSLCQTGLLLNQGKLKFFGPVQQCVEVYLSGSLNPHLSWQGTEGDEQVLIYAAQIHGANLNGLFYKGQPLNLTVDYEVFSSHPRLVFCFEIWNKRHQLLASSHTCEDFNVFQKAQQPGCHRLSFTIDTRSLRPGDYYIKVGCLVPHQKAIVVNNQITLSFSLWSSPTEQVSPVPDYFKGGMFLGANWQIDS